MDDEIALAEAQRAKTRPGRRSGPRRFALLLTWSAVRGKTNGRVGSRDAVGRCRMRTSVPGRANTNEEGNPGVMRKFPRSDQYPAATPTHDPRNRSRFKVWSLQHDTTPNGNYWHDM